MFFLLGYNAGDYMDSSRHAPGTETSDITMERKPQKVEHTAAPARFHSAPARSPSADARKAALDELQKAYKELSDLEKDMPRFRSRTPPPADR